MKYLHNNTLNEIIYSDTLAVNYNEKYCTIDIRSYSDLLGLFLQKSSTLQACALNSLVD